jgi:hypothetical protein
MVMSAQYVSKILFFFGGGAISVVWCVDRLWFLHLCCHFKVDDVSALEATYVSRSRQYALLKTTSQRHCISNVRHDHGYGLDAVTT